MVQRRAIRLEIFSFSASILLARLGDTGIASYLNKILHHATIPLGTRPNTEWCQQNRPVIR